MFNRLKVIIEITFLDCFRNKITVGSLIFLLISSFTTFVIANLASQDVGKVAVDFVLSSFSIFGLFLIFFACGNSINRDIDRKTIAILLSKAISRKEYILSRFFGYLLFVAFLSLLAALIGLLTLFVIKLIFAKYFYTNFSIISIAFLYTFLGFAIMLAVLIFFSSLTTSSYTALVLSILVYFVGNSIGDLRDFAESEQAIASGFSPLFRYLLRIVHFIVPDLAKFNLKIFAANGLPLEANFIVYSILYATVYITILILLAMKAFEKREFV